MGCQVDIWKKKENGALNWWAWAPGGNGVMN